MTEREKMVVDYKLENPKVSKRDAYMKFMPTDNPASAATQAWRLFKKPEIQIYKQGVINSAKKTIKELIKQGKTDDVRLRASQDVLDRIYGKPTVRQEVRSTAVSVNINLAGDTIYSVGDEDKPNTD